MYLTVSMANPYDMALRERVVGAYEAGRGTALEIAETFGVAHRTVQRWTARWRATGSVAAIPKGGGQRSPIDLTVLDALIREAPDATCAELCWAYNRRVALARRTTLTSVWRAMRRRGYVLKKNGRGRVKSTARMSRPRARHS
jgi:transposase